MRTWKPVDRDFLNHFVLTSIERSYIFNVTYEYLIDFNTGWFIWYWEGEEFEIDVDDESCIEILESLIDEEDFLQENKYFRVEFISRSFETYWLREIIRDMIQEIYLAEEMK